ncbi:unnamed protein product, partial [Ectocarpus sp. 12 AP-2014]
MVAIRSHLSLCGLHPKCSPFPPPHYDWREERASSASWECRSSNCSNAFGRADAKGGVRKRHHGRSQHVEAGSAGLPQ